jgi:hypothetical protein
VNKAVALATAGAVIAVGVVVYWLVHPLPLPRIAGSTQITNDGRTKFAPTLTDGLRLYFVAMDGNALYQTSVAGGEPVPYSHIFHSQVATLAGISPDGSQWRVHSGQGTNPEGPLLIIPALGGPARSGRIRTTARVLRRAQIALCHAQVSVEPRSHRNRPKMTPTVDPPVFTTGWDAEDSVEVHAHLHRCSPA